MPVKLTTQQAKQRYEQYGFIVPSNFNYTNNKRKYRVYDTNNNQYVNLSLNELNIYNKRGKILDNEQQAIQQLYNLPLSDQEPNQQLSSFERWLTKQDNDIQVMNTNDQTKLYETMQTIAKQMVKKKAFTIDLDNKHLSLRALTLASKIVGSRLGNIDIRMTFEGDNGLLDYRHLTPNTVNYLNQLFNTENLDNIKDSSDNPLTSYLNYHSVSLEFVPRKTGRRIAAGFFPYWNISDIDLSMFGIFNKDASKEQLAEPCLLTALKHSGEVTDEQIEMIKYFIKTRLIPTTCIKDIAELLKKYISIKILYGFNGKESHRDYGKEYEANGTIKLFIINGHYLLNKTVNVTERYINNYEEIHKDNRFINHSRRYLLKQYDSNRYSFAKSGLNIIKTIKLLINNELLVPMNDKDIDKLSWLYQPLYAPSFTGYYRPIIIDDVKKTNKQYHHGKLLFGFDPVNEQEEQQLLDELQEVINSLPLRNPINVRYYYKFSSLMQKIMYEFGCYDGVLECCGKLAQEVREQLSFPVPHTYNHQPLSLLGKYYYVDLNGAYMSVIKGIPNANGVMNTKIVELIDRLYTIRKGLTSKLSITIKFLMNSCWGWSIRKQKLIKHKHTNNVAYNLEEFAPFIVKYDRYSYDVINSFVPHFTCPHFAKSVLDSYNSLMDKVRGLVNVLYENIDAILINEEDYNKLNELGYIGKNLGQFKVEKVFSSIHIRSPKRYTAIDYATGEVINH